MPTYEIDKSGNLLIDGVNGGAIDQIVKEHQDANGLLVAAVKAQADADAADKDAAIAALTDAQAKAIADAQTASTAALTDLATTHAEQLLFARQAYDAELQGVSDEVAALSAKYQSMTAAGRDAAKARAVAQKKAELAALEAG